MFAELVWDTLVKPVQTLRKVAEEKRTVAGIGLFFIVWILEVVSWFVFSRGDAVAAQSALDPASTESLANASEAIYPFVLAAMPLGWLFLAIVLYNMGNIFHGTGTLGGVIAALGFAQAPGLVNVALSAVFESLGSSIAILGAFISLILASWGLALQILAVRESMSLSTGRAIAAWLLGGFLFFGLLVMLATVFVLFTGLR